MALIGYARVSTDDQTVAQQTTALRAAGCGEVFTETASGASRARPVLGQALERLGRGDVLVCVRLDRLARSLIHLLDLIEGLAARGIGFRALADPVDTTSPQGRFTLQILGAVAEFERALIRERTAAGLARARAAGRRGGNPALGDPATQAALAARRDAARTARLVADAGPLLDLLARLRPAQPWDTVAGVAGLRGLRRPDGGAWTRDSVIRAAGRLVRAGLLAPRVLTRAPRGPQALVETMAALHAALSAGGAPPPLATLARALETARVRAPQGGQRWHPSSVRHLLDRAAAEGLIVPS